MPNWSHDHVLSSLQGLPDPVGSLVRAFPGRRAAADDEWLEKWFVGMVRGFIRGRGPDVDRIVASAVGDADISALSKPPVQDVVRLSSIRPSYFRGFRDPVSAINLEAGLIVLEGRNSSGKTSVSEAIEWAITGHLSRRDSGEHGHPSELAGCIANEFRPEGKETFVELGLKLNGTPTTIRRVLRRDYSKVAADSPVSDIFVDGKQLSDTEEADLLNRLFAGVHPILMQHNLRRFVHDEPHARRQYFERLLQIDELTALIEKAVIGPARLKQIINPDGGTGLAALRALTAELERMPDGSSLAAAISKLERLKAADLPTQLEKGLLKVSSTYFAKDIPEGTSLAQARDKLGEAQRLQRESRLPILASLTSARSHDVDEWTPIAAAMAAFASQATALRELTTAAESLTVAQREVSRVAAHLASQGLLDLASDQSQVCPLCEDQHGTLTPQRVSALASWAPVASAVTDAQVALGQLRTRAGELLASLRKSLHASIPDLPAKKELDRQLKNANQRVASLTADAVLTAGLLTTGRSNANKAIDALEHSLIALPLDAATFRDAGDTLAASLTVFPGALAQHREVVADLEEAVGTASRDDAIYRLRDKWLDVASLTAALAEDTTWESAKQATKSSLDSLRDGLIALRSQIIEHARHKFSDDMTSVWHLLRRDSGAQFSRIFVPEARGKGYKLEFELKAIISDGSTAPEVDALRVFSESQVNVVGLAAYITRARSLGHRLLIFDDPVQSMDEEHFNSFAGELLTALLEEGFQILILTHSDTFARRLNEHHFQRESYVTLESRASKRDGCQVEEGNRRVTERLKNAQKAASNGDLQGAWRLVRLALERLYTLAYLKQTEGFDPQKWANMSAEDMWRQGADKVFEKAVPGCGIRLKSILSATAAGAHDKSATSETDLQDAVKYINTLLTPLRVGSG
jgi:hypothetical protein